MRRRLILALLGVTAILSLTASSCEHKPKERFIERVEQFCGPDVAARYSQIQWVDRDYAADNLLITCVLWPELTRDNVNKDQVGG
jgi:hypothetical protein